MALGIRPPQCCAEARIEVAGTSLGRHPARGRGWEAQIVERAENVVLRLLVVDFRSRGWEGVNRNPWGGGGPVKRTPELDILASHGDDRDHQNKANEG